MPSSVLNSDDGVISGTSGLKSTGGDDGVLNIQNNGTTAVTVASDGDVGIGRTPVAYGSFKVLDVAGSTGSIQKWVHTGSTVELQAYSSSTLTAIGSATNHPLILTTNDAERARVTTDGYLRMASGSGGIQFNGDTAAANALDDYEEGTWTPVFTYSTPGTLSTTQEGRGSYRKIGSVVYFTSDIRINAFTKGTASGDLLITGFPFTSLNVAGFQDARIIINLWEWTFSSQPVAKVDGNTTFSTLGRMRSNQTQTALDDPKSGSIIWLTGFYFTA
jgi:hypothetical protein